MYLGKRFQNCMLVLQNGQIVFPLDQSVLINTTSLQHAGIPTIKAFTGLDMTPPFATFYRSSLPEPVAIPDIDRERILNCRQLGEVLCSMQPVMQSNLQKNSSPAAMQSSK